MKKAVLLLGVAVLTQHVAIAQLAVLYTNAPDGATITLSQNVSVTNSLINIGNTAGIAFSNGTGSGKLAGIGDLSVYNTTSLGGSSAYYLYGTYADSLSITQYTGSISVVSDLTTFSVTNSSGYAYARTYARGIRGDLTGNIIGSITTTARGGHALITGSSGYAYGRADAYGIYGDVSGDVLGSVSATAEGGRASSSGDSAYARAYAYGIYGNVNGNVGGSVSAESTGGNVYSTSSSAQAYTYARGIYNGDITGNLSGSITATSKGEIAFSTDSYAYTYALAYGVHICDVGGDMSGKIIAESTGGNSTAAGSSGSARSYAQAHGIYSGTITSNMTGTIRATASAGNAYSASYLAYAYAQARGLYGNVLGNMKGTIHAEAKAGNAHTSSTSDDADAYAQAYGIYSLNRIDNNISGAVYAIAEAGSAHSYVSRDASADINAYARAYGIYRAGTVDNFSGTIRATAIGGNAVSLYTAGNQNASAQAIGIHGYGYDLSISNFTGNIIAKAVAGVSSVTVSDISNVDQATAYGIWESGNNTLYLNAVGGSIHAMIEAPEGYTLDKLLTGSRARAILSGNQNDSVVLSNIDIIGDIDLEGGVNQFDILGDTRIDGDIYATSGLNNFRIMSGFLTPIGTVRVSDLENNEVIVSGSGGLNFELYEDPASPFNSKFTVEGAVNAGNSTPVAAQAAAGQRAANIIGKNYEVITAANGITGTFAESSRSLFTLAIYNGTTNVIITPTGLRPHRGSNTPSSGSMAKATVTSACAVMDDLSRHTGGIRTMLRGGAGPQGAAGPDEETEELKTGEWKSYVRQFNNLGEQDSEGGIAGYDWNSHGFILGAEKLVSESLVIGTAAGGSWTDLDGKLGAGGGNSDLFMGTVYGNWVDEKSYLELGLAYAHAWNETVRNATDGRNTGDYDSDLIGGWLEVGNIISEKYNNIETYARTAYIHGKHDGYTDQGTAVPLTIDSFETDNWLVELGVRGKQEWTLKNESLISLVLKAGWRAELLDNTIDANGRLLGANIPVESPESDKNALVLGAEANWKMSDVSSLGLAYEPVYSGNWYYHNISGKLSYRF